MAIVNYIIVLSLLLSLVWCQNVIQLQTKTGDEDGDGMNTGSIDIELYNSAFVRCRIEDLDGNGNDFKKGNIDTFEV